MLFKNKAGGIKFIALLYSKTGNKNYLEQLYYFDQQNKASVLAFNQEFSELAQQTNSHLLQNVQDLKRKITALSIKANTITDSLQLATISVSIRNLEIELGKKQDELAKQAMSPTYVSASLRGRVSA